MMSSIIFEYRENRYNGGIGACNTCLSHITWESDMIPPSTYYPTNYDNNPAPLNEQKVCSRCSIPKHVDSFYVAPKRKDGRQPWCIDCAREYRRYRKENGITRSRLVAPLGLKICYRRDCPSNGVPQPLENFHKRSTIKNGLESACKVCINADTRSWRNEHRDYDMERTAQWYEDNLKNAKDYAHNPDVDPDSIDKVLWTKKRWAASSVSRCRSRAARKNLPFDLEGSDLFPLPEFCPVFGLRLDYNAGPNLRIQASVDRIIPALGYVKGNVRVISRSANLAKMDGIGDVFVRRVPKQKKNDDQLSLFGNIERIYEAAD